MKKFLLVGLLCLLPSLSFADKSCLEIKNFNDPSGQKEEQTMEGIDSMADPAKDLFGCFSGVASGLAKGDVAGGCGCKQAIKKLCSFNTRKKRISASGGADVAWCAVFAPWAL
jgi:hypothetical protein